jgi:hypothetical protein
MEADVDTDSMGRLGSGTDVIGLPMPTLPSVTGNISGITPMLRWHRLNRIGNRIEPEIFFQQPNIPGLVKILVYL